MLEFMKKYERRLQRPVGDGVLFDEHFTRDDFKAITLAWLRRNRTDAQEKAQRNR